MRFEQYHPMMTANYTLDWLTTFSIKTIFQQLPQATVRSANWSAAPNMTNLAHRINWAMRQTMSEKALIWGVEKRLSKQFIGVFGFYELQAGQAELRFLLPDLAMATEITTYLIHFAREQLRLQTLSVMLPAKPELIAAFKQLGFQETPKEPLKFSLILMPDN